MKVSVIMPAKNEAKAIGKVVEKLRELYPAYQILVVDDGSGDDTSRVAKEAGADVVSHPVSLGNGAAIKTGARSADGDVLVFMDADGQHRPEDVEVLVSDFNKGFDMVIGAREFSSQASVGRGMANYIFNKFAGYITSTNIADLTSGFRVVDAAKFRDILYLLPNKFSYPTTSTMAFLRNGYSIKFTTVVVEKREGRSHIKPLQDGMKFLLIIFKVATLYSPLKIFFPGSLTFFSLGVLYYLYTYFTDGRFTNMGALLLTVSVLVFFMGLLSEQITMITYKK